MLVLIFATSCVDLYIRENFTYLFDGKNTGIDTLLHVDGYFINLDAKCSDYSDSKFMFYRDGTFTNCMFVNKFKNDNVKEETVSMIFGWGRYIIEGDTIKAQTVISPNGHYFGTIYFYKLYVIEQWFKIINKDTLKEIFWKDLIEKRPKEKLCECNSPISYYISLKNKPDSLCELKENKWAWKDGKIIK